MTRGRSEAGYRAGLSSRRSRVRAPSLPIRFQRKTRHSLTGFFFELRAVAQGLARLVRDQDVGGSNPLSPTSTLLYNNISKPWLAGFRVDSLIVTQLLPEIGRRDHGTETGCRFQAVYRKNNRNRSSKSASIVLSPNFSAAV